MNMTKSLGKKNKKKYQDKDKYDKYCRLKSKNKTIRPGHKKARTLNRTKRPEEKPGKMPWTTSKTKNT